MLRTYKAILHGDQVEWLEQPPEKSQPVQVHITVLEEPLAEPTRERGRAMAEALAALARRGPLWRSPTLCNGNASYELNVNCLTGSRDAAG